MGVGRAAFFVVSEVSMLTKEGLPTSITSLYDDKNGSLWVGTTQGIYSFNGEKIKKYNLPDLLRKNSHYINDIFGDNEERIWAVT